MNFRTASKKLLYSMFALTIMFSVACKKDNDNPGPGPGTSKKITRIQEDANNYMSFEYNPDGTFKKIVNVSEDEEVLDLGTVTFVYNANKKVTEVNSTDGTKIKYTYANNLPTVAEVFSEDEKVATLKFAHQGGKAVSTTMTNIFEDEEGEPVEMDFMKMEYQYYANGDLKEVKLSSLNVMSGELEVVSTIKYEQYDNKINPLSQLGEVALIFFADASERNALLIKTFDEDGTLDETVQNEFTYDAAGYPLTSKETTTPAGGAASVKNITYTYN